MSTINDVSSTDDLDRILGSEKPVFLFKHSTACGTSSYANDVFEEFVAGHAGDVVFARVLVLESRQVSDTVAERLGVRHASPQVLLVVGGQTEWYTSHYSITQESLGEALTAVSA